MTYVPISSRTLLLTLSLGASVVGCSGSTQVPDPGDTTGDGDGDGMGAAAGDGDSSLGDGDGDRAPASIESVLVGRNFILHSADGVDLVDDTEVTLGFTEGFLNFRAGCGGRYGEVSFEDETLDVSSFNYDPLTCEESLEQVGWLEQFYTSSPTVTLSDDVLTLTLDEVTLVFVEGVPPSPDLVATEWTVSSFVEGPVAWGGVWDDPPIFVFNEDGTLDVTTPCNDGLGTYKVEGRTIILGSVEYTEIGCPDEETQMAESAMQNVFRSGELTFEIGRLTITLMHGEDGVNAWTE